MTAASASQSSEMARRRSIAFLNWAHAIDHFVLLIYPTVVIGLEIVYQRPYSELIALSSAAFVAFGIFSLPAGWLADRWSRRNMMVAFYIGCGLSLAGTAFAPTPMWLAVGMFMLGVFAAIYHPVGMAMLIEASGAKGRTLAFNGVCGTLGVSLAAGTSAALATWSSWRAAFLAPAVICVATGIVYYWLTPDDRHHVNTRQSKPAVPLTAKVAAMLFGLFLVIALSAGLVFNVLTIALPKIVDEGM
ncbi:MAG TPA: MFS transporter, partial [Pseudolabrys sp.]|nr:MFS transporter [Pseudolabrys sp.]